MDPASSPPLERAIWEVTDPGEVVRRERSGLPLIELIL
jgi:hypothetical protein